MERLILNAFDYIKPFAISKFIAQNKGKSIVWIKPNKEKGTDIKEYINFFLPNFQILQIYDLDTNYNDLIKPDKNIILSRILALYSIMKNQFPKLIVTSESVIKQQTISSEGLLNNILTLTKKQNIDNIQSKLVKLGYERQNIVSSCGEFALRGEVLDIFVDKPYRINASFSTIEKMREIDQLTQLTFGKEIEKITVFPVTEMLGDNLSTVASYFDKNFLLFQEDNFDTTLQCSEVFNFSKFSDKASEFKKIYLKHNEIFFPKKVNIFNQIGDIIKTSNKRIIIATPNIILAKRLSQILKINICESYDKFSSTMIGLFKVKKSFETEKLIIISDNDIFQDYIGRTSRKINKDDILKQANSLVEGDLVIHINHGLGKFNRLISLQVNQKLHDFLEIEYDNNEKLFLPVENFSLLSRYSCDSDSFSLDKLGSKSWEKKKSKIKSKINELAAELIKTAAIRESIKIPATFFDEEELLKFCNNFPHVETSDQYNAIQDVINDLSSGKVMDRLICGDVGFGKTEVALRAAFIVSRTKQVAIVAPTTLLCKQLYEVFFKRFEDFNTKITKIYRLSNSIADKESVSKEDNGIIIGTHSIFRQKFKNLGMLIVDEEQHFGVKQKEMLKNAYPNLHIMTMTATPIPRTLQMSISGIKDISIIATPPFERVPARIVVSPIDINIIREAILRETNNGGQVFYTCPYISDIKDAEELLLRSVPEIQYKTLHGKMPAQQIAHTMQEFIDNKFKLLISTNIIESGIDIKNANTIIIHNAHMFGLSSLYQLRGRVGRSDVQGFTYCLIPHDKEITPNAEKRLALMQRLEKLGAGFSLASYDMDIRGSGNILGEEQSGHIKEIGVELYQKMLKNAIESSPEEHEITINLNVPVLIPDTYIESNKDRISYYQRISEAQTKQDLLLIKSELEDCFGKIPQETTNLLYIVDIKNICRKFNIISVDYSTKGVLIEFSNVKDICALLELSRQNPGRMEFKPANKIFLHKSFKLKDFLAQYMTYL